MNASTKRGRCRRGRAAERPASCRPAAQPSVRASSAATWSGPSSSPITWLRNSAGLGGREPQVGGAQLEQLAARPQPRQRQRRVGPGRHRDADPRRQVLQEEGDGVVHGGFVDDVVVVERQHRGPVELVEVVDQAGQDRLGRDLAAGLEQGRGLGRLRRPTRRRRPDGSGTGGGRCRRRPATARPRRAGGSSPARQPLGQQRRLAEPGRRRDEHQPRGHRPGRWGAGRSAGVGGPARRRGAGTCSFVPSTTMTRA